MDLIKALQIFMAAVSAAIIKEFYDTTKQEESTQTFIAETLMGILLGLIVGFIAQNFINDIMYVMGLTAASSIVIKGPDDFSKLFRRWVESKLGIDKDEKDNDDKDAQEKDKQ